MVIFIAFLLMIPVSLPVWTEVMICIGLTCVANSHLDVTWMRGDACVSPVSRA